MGSSHLSPWGTKIAVLEVSIAQSIAQLGTSETFGVGILASVFSCELSPGVSRCIQLTVEDNSHPPRALGTAGYSLRLSLSAGV